MWTYLNIYASIMEVICFYLLPEVGKSLFVLIAL